MKKTKFSAHYGTSQNGRMRVARGGTNHIQEKPQLNDARKVFTDALMYICTYKYLDMVIMFGRYQNENSNKLDDGVVPALLLMCIL